MSAKFSLCNTPTRKGQFLEGPEANALNRGLQRPHQASQCATRRHLRHASVARAPALDQPRRLAQQHGR